MLLTKIAFRVKNYLRTIKNTFLEEKSPVRNATDFYDISNGNIITINIPRVIVQKGRFIINIIDEKIIKDELFLRIDAYPHIAPKYGARHFGFVDIPFNMMKIGENIILYDCKSFFIGNNVYRYSEDFYEDGAVIFHMHVVGNGHIKSCCKSDFTYQYSTSFIPKLKSTHVGISTVCNLHCTMCMRETRDGYTPTNRAMGIDEANRLALMLKDLKCALLLGIGEPLLNKNYLEIVRIFREKMGMDAEINSGTNGTLLTNSLAVGIAHSGLSGIGFSIDGATKETYEKIRIGANFDQVISNIKFFVHYVAENKISMHIWVNFVVQPSNIDECKDFLCLMSSIGVQDIRFSIIQYYNKNGSYDDYESVFLEKLGSIEKDCKTKAAALGVICNFESTLNIKNSSEELLKKGITLKLFCPFVEFYLMNDDNIADKNAFCCNSLFTNPPYSEEAEDIFIELRKSLILGEFPNICKRCHMIQTF